MDTDTTAATTPSGATTTHDAPAAGSALLRGLGLGAVASVPAALVTAVVLVAFGSVSFPAYGNSHVLQALTVVGQVAALILVAAGVALDHRSKRARRPGRRGEILGVLGVSTGMALLVVSTLGIPLAATRLYLMGVSVDQEFRTQFLTRTTAEAGLPDMAYADLPSFYPSGWFWLGGRFARLAGLDGWAAYKPWAILSLAVASALVAVLWTRLLRTGPGALAALASVAVMLAYGSPEPYGAVVALFAPPMLVLAWHAVHPTSPRLGRGATAAVLLFLGASACFYTLYTAVTAATVVLMAVVSALLVRWRSRDDARPPHTGTTPHGPLLPILRLAVIGVGSALLALLVWAPYLLRAAGAEQSESGTAFHYLPASGARLPLPMFQGGIVGWLCLAGLVWIVLRCATSRRAQALGIGVATVYLWCLASMSLTALGTTLLAFRTEVVLITELAVAGVFALLEIAGAAVRAAGRQDGRARPAAEAESRRRTLAAALMVLAALSTIAFTQSIPGHLEPEIRVAYTDTDGDGVRADRYPAGPESHYREVDEVIRSAFPDRAPTDIVVASTADGFLAYHPYLAYQAVTSHYANPLGRYAERNAVMRSWESAESPDELYRLMTGTPWRAPDVVLARPGGAGYSLRLAEDVYPNDPNVRRFAVTIPADAVSGPHFRVHEVGPFAVIVVR